MKKIMIVAAGVALLAQGSVYGIDAKYRQMLERSGCTQVTEMQGCDINKSKEENAKAGFGSETHAEKAGATSHTP